MKVLSLCQKLNFKLPVESLECLGDGSDGEVFTIASDKNTVIKLCIIYEYDEDCERLYEKTRSNLLFVMENKPSAYVRVHTHGYLGSSVRPFDTRMQKFIIHYYTMEKLRKISEDECRVFSSILSYEDCGIKKDYSPKKFKEILTGLRRRLDFDAEKVTLFCNNIEAAPIVYNDLHIMNIMKDASGNFKLIDLDRMELEK
ncbi:MAG TPA: hypothetical protein VII94_06230 [Candidatus Saccharimonadales bacterium]